MKSAASSSLWFSQYDANTRLSALEKDDSRMARPFISSVIHGGASGTSVRSPVSRYTPGGYVPHELPGYAPRITAIFPCHRS